MPSIKVQSSDKGKSHWESFLLKKQEIRLLKLMNRLEVKQTTQNQIMRMFKRQVDFSNIIPLSNHDIKTFLHGLINGELEELTKSGTVTIIKHSINEN